MSGNMGFLFYKEYYRKFTPNDWNEIITQKNAKNIRLKDATLRHIQAINNSILSAYGKNKNFKPLFKAPLSIDLKTIYPGLVIGTGYHHQTGIEGEFKLGFYFDYTTGLPVIPGSSVKGALRSVFPMRDKHKSQEKAEYIFELLKTDSNFDEKKFQENVSSQNSSSLEDQIKILEAAIFEGIKSHDFQKNKDEYFPMAHRDIFYDAFPVRVGDDGLFRDDFITPHKDSLKNPIPLMFLKVAPSVTFRFNFKLTDDIIPKNVKLKLFLNILLDMGVGAKTNVGYGKFDDSNKSKLMDDVDKQYTEQKQQEKRASMAESERKEAEKAAFMEEIKNYHGQPAKIFNKWKSNSNLKNNKEVALAMLQIFKSMPSKPQLKYLADVLGVERNELKKRFIKN